MSSSIIVWKYVKFEVIVFSHFNFRISLKCIFVIVFRTYYAINRYIILNIFSTCNDVIEIIILLNIVNSESNRIQIIFIEVYLILCCVFYGATSTK